MAGRVDYWANVPALTTVKDLCAALAQPKRSWLILDQERLQYALAGPMSEVIHGATKVLWRGPEGALVNRADPVLRWSSTAQRHCSVTAPKPPVVPAGADVALPP